MKKSIILILLFSLSLSQEEPHIPSPFDEIPDHILDRDSNDLKYRVELGSKDLDFEFAHIPHEEYMEQVEMASHDDAIRSDFIIALKGKEDAVNYFV